MKYVLLICIVLSIGSAFAGYEDTIHSNKFVEYFKKGHLSGQIRNFTMATINQGVLSNYHASAIGASIHFETAPIKGFSAGLNGIFVYRLFSNDLLELDAQSGSMSKYELQLFDVEHKGNFNDLDRLEELYLKYQHKGLQFVLGKMEIETPLVNMHDGRMKPKVFSGIKGNYKWNNTAFTAAWLNKASPRSTTHWYTIGEAIGLYSNGCSPEGTIADYHENISSKGLGIVGIESSRGENSTFSFWNYYLDNISTTSLAKIQIDVDSSFYGGAMYLNQIPMGNGGAENHEETYRFTNKYTHSFSARIGYHFRLFDLQMSATHILDEGMFLFPREFGVDPFYTFISRSQIEGTSDATSMLLSIIKEFKNTSVHLHWNRMLTQSDFGQNKYQLASYDQFNLDYRYQCKGKLDGLDLRLLFVYRRALAKNIEPSREHNQVNFNQFNLVANFNF